MARPKTENLTPLELEIMHVLWETGPANVMTVQQKLKRELAYTTVQTMLNILSTKGKAKRTLKNRAYFYKPAVSRKQVVSKHVIDVVDRLFGGSAESLVMSLLETKHLTPAKLARLQKLIAEVEEEVDENSSELLLTFLLNACWQIALIAAFASFGSWLLRNSYARHRHRLWVSALCLAFLVPALTSSRVLFETAPQPDARVPFNTVLRQPFSAQFVPAPPPTIAAPASTFQLNQSLGSRIACALLRLSRLSQFQVGPSLANTRTIRLHAVELEPDDRVAEIIADCERELGRRPGEVRVLRSETLPVPVTMGRSQPVTILPEALLREGNIDLLTSAIGHEFIHVARRDYLLNFIYELLFVPIPFILPWLF